MTFQGFSCSACGACCRQLYHVPELADFDRGDGVCAHLEGEPGEEHRCRIYETRPPVCRVDESCPTWARPSWWARTNEGACRKLHLLVYGQELK